MKILLTLFLQTCHCVQKKGKGEKIYRKDILKLYNIPLKVLT